MAAGPKSQTPKPQESKPEVPKPEEDSWQRARLIPTTGIGGQDEQEQRATSSLLAVMSAVPAFGRALLDHAKAPAGRIRTFTEVRFTDEDEKVLRPDGAILVERGKTKWRCLVEVKTGGVPLVADQINRYLDLARVRGFDAVLTISNQITSSPSVSPLAVNGRRLRRVTLWHLSWWQILTDAVLEHQHRGISDPDQAWILGELIDYLMNERSGAGGFEDMGDKWVAVRDAARQRTLRASDVGVKDVAARWEQYIQYLALGLRQDLGRDVVPLWPRKLEGAARTDSLVRSLVDHGHLEASIRVPDAAAPIDIEADLRTRQLTTSVEIASPREGRPKTQVSWILRQLKDAPDTLRIDARFASTKDSASMLLRDVRDKPERLLLASDPHREPRSFRLALSKDLGTKRGKGAGSFVGDTKQQALDFYRGIVQHVRPWTPRPPRLPEPQAPAIEEGPIPMPTASDSTPASSGVGDGEAP